MNKETSASSVPIPLASLAQRLGEGTLQRSQSFKTTVLLGERLIFKLPEQSQKKTDTDRKEIRVLQLLAERLDPDWGHVVPRFIAAEPVEGIGLVQVHTRLKGDHPQEVSTQLASDLGSFLRALHKIGGWNALSEFESEETVSFREYLQIAPRKFASKLNDVVSAEDRQLVVRALEYVAAVEKSLNSDPPLVLVHKDIYLGNVLADASGRLSGVVDWAAAQTAPREWEFSILRQRMPDDWQMVLNAYGHILDNKLMDLCGVVQGLRFWKSFPHQPEFVSQQRDYLKVILSNV